MNFDEARIINLPKILDPRGNLSFFENENQIPFNIQRAYWIYDVPGGEQRGGHALNDGESERKYSLNRSYYGLFTPNLLWRSIENFSTNSLALIVSSIKYDERDYIRDFKEFKDFRNEF